MFNSSNTGGDLLLLPSEEDVDEFWSQTLAKTGFTGRLPVLIAGSESFALALEEGRYLKPLVEATARSLTQNARICDTVLLVGSSSHDGSSQEADVAWDNIIQQTVFEVAGAAGNIPMVMLKFEQTGAPHNPKDFVTVREGSPTVVTIQLPTGVDKHFMSHGWKAVAAPAALSFGGGPRDVQLISRRGTEGTLAHELKQLAIPIPAAGGFGAELAVGKGPPSWPEQFRPEGVTEALWLELKSVAEGEIEAAGIEEYATKVVQALQAVVQCGLRQDKPMLARPASAASSDAAATPGPGGFPESLGPFDLVPTSFRPAHFRLFARGGPPNSWTLQPSSLPLDQRRALKMIKAASFTGRLSPQMPVTLSKADREAANIPQEAAFFCWSYPIQQEMPAPPSDITAEFAFLAFGGFMYFDKAQKVVCVLALKAGSEAGGLRFGDPIPFTVEMSAKVTNDRFKPVTIPALRETGVQFFCWMKPGELEGAEHGAFAYLFHRRILLDTVPEDLLARDVFFPVLGKATAASKRVSQTLTAHGASKTGSSKAAAPPLERKKTPPPERKKTPPLERKKTPPPERPRTGRSPGPLGRPSKFSPAPRKPPAGPPAPPWDSQVQISVWPGVDPSARGEGHVLISVEPPDGAASQCTSLCCVIDVSGSMGKEAVIQGAGGANETTGLSLLDIAKHGIRTLIHTLGDQDRLSVVSFSTTAYSVVLPTRMDAEGKRKAEEQLERLQAKGGTNLWAGLETGLELLRQFQDEGSFSHVMLLTDGESTKREEIPTNLTAWCRRWPASVPCTINTFGFGYNLDSNLLVDLANKGNGTYSFIPDAGFVGTVFVNTVSNLLVTMGANASLELQTGPSAEVIGIYGGYKLQAPGHDPSVKKVQIGNLQFGQSRDIVVRMKFTGAESKHPYLRVSGQFKLGKVPESQAGGSYLPRGYVHYGMETWLPNSTARFLPQPSGIDSVEQNFWRLSFIDALQQAITQANAGEREAAINTITTIRQGIEASPAADSEVLKSLLEDVTGQTSEALSRQDWWTKWGRHFLPSLKFAHHVQQCNNFKDPGVQAYGGTLFETIRDQADDVFNDLPPPKPTARPPVRTSSAGSTASTVTRAPVVRPVVSMAAFNDCYGG